MAKSKPNPKPKTVKMSVVGVNYRVTPGTLRKMQDNLPLHCRLEREPENDHDPNAVKVIVLERPWREVHIGYLPRQVAGVVAQGMDTGKWKLTNAWLTVLDDHGRGEILLSKPNS